MIDLRKVSDDFFTMGYGLHDEPYAYFETAKRVPEAKLDLPDAVWYSLKEGLLHGK